MSKVGKKFLAIVSALLIVTVLIILAIYEFLFINFNTEVLENYAKASVSSLKSDMQVEFERANAVAERLAAAIAQHQLVKTFVFNLRKIEMVVMET